MAPNTLRQPRRRFEQLRSEPLVLRLQRRHLPRHRDLDEELWQACAIFGDSPGDSGYQIRVPGSGPGSESLEGFLFYSLIAMNHPAIPLSPDPVLSPSPVDGSARPLTPSLSSGSSAPSPLVPLPLYIIAGGYGFQRLPAEDDEDGVIDWRNPLIAPEESL
ncbi:hypothetical protein AUEXF2481DRAFT_28443 [Aureobasidium subglaciale EXF-2481]|uniref:Uncharacterized protein n=1 Tax=Aureobasidium subglaciale (strain EXF-2481) TaxID=1043005 RepID=A0A074YQW0_AURSE|nr:uncharacterized protein AUEXF2481DRAFT_28443 [Aureobasidium subglaciale EXF-2481]KEQ96502.1 hypothetical protein AUEXF2481DRAFT_28443 [Aureobasidium subglaciale EXF-2481]